MFIWQLLIIVAYSTWRHFTVVAAGAEYQHMRATIPGPSQQTRYIEPMLVYCWADVADDGPTLNEHWFNVTCLLLICKGKKQ